jgi:hypothetical protein
MIKKLYTFNIKKVTEVEEIKENDDGSKTVKKVPGEVSIPFVIAKPTRQMLEDGELYYNQKYSYYLKAEVMPEVLLRKMYGNENGIFTEDEKKEYWNLYIEMGKNMLRIQEQEAKNELSKEEKDEITSLHKRNKEINGEINRYENAKKSVLDNSAETLASNKTFFWWFLKLTHNEDLTPLFPGETHEEKLESFDKIQEKIDEGGDEGDFYSKLVNRASFLSSICYQNGVTKPVEFEKLVAQYDAANEELEETEE